MAEYLQCGVCFEPYTAGSRLPKFLQCGGGIQHTYCLQCLRRLTVGGMIKCPTCGDLTAVTGTADRLKNNIYLMPQIEAAASSAQARIGLEMFCQNCSGVATERCGEHQLLKISELRDLLRQKAETGAARMDSVKQKRAVVVELFREAHGVLASVAESVRRTIDDYEMDVQLDDNIVSELERKREEAESLPLDELVDSYRFIEQHAADAAAALRDTDALAQQCGALLAGSVSLAALNNGLQQTFPVGEWLHSGDLMQALLAATVVVYSLDHVTSEGGDGAATAEEDVVCCKGSEAAHSIVAAKQSNASDTKPAKVLKNGDIEKSNSKSSSKSLPSCNGKASAQSANPETGPKLVTKSSKSAVTVPVGKGSSSLTASNKTKTGETSDSGKSSKTTLTSVKPSQSKSASQSAAAGKVSSAPAGTTASATKTTNGLATPAKPAATATKTKAAPSFSTMVKNAAPDSAAVTAATTAAALALAKKLAAAAAATTTVTTRPAATTAAAVALAKRVAAAAALTTTVTTRPAAKAVKTTSVPRAPRGVNPMYCLRVTNGSSTTDVIIELRPDMAPVMCKNFILLCEGGFFDKSRFHFAVAGDYLLGGRVDDDEGLSPLAQAPDKFVMADQCPLQDECGAIRMKGMGTVTGPGGEKRGLIGSQFMMWVSETRDYRQYHYTLVFGFVRQGLDFIRGISNMDRPAIWRNARLLSTKPYPQ